MGQTEANFGAVSTQGLINRIKRQGAQEKERIDRMLLTRNIKQRLKGIIDQTIAEIDRMWMCVQAGHMAESELREELIALLDPRMRGGRRKIRFRW